MTNEQEKIHSALVVSTEQFETMSNWLRRIHDQLEPLLKPEDRAGWDGKDIGELAYLISRSWSRVEAAAILAREEYERKAAEIGGRLIATADRASADRIKKVEDLLWDILEARKHGDSDDLERELDKAAEEMGW